MRATHLLAIDELLRERGAASAVLFGPADSDPSAGVHLLVPGDATLPMARAFVGEGPCGLLATLAAWQVGFEPAPPVLNLKSIVPRRQPELASSSAKSKD